MCLFTLRRVFCALICLGLSRGVLSKRVDLAWTCQPFLAGTYRSVYRWVSDKPGTGAALAAVYALGITYDLRLLRIVLLIMTVLVGCTPELGIHYAQTDSAGRILFLRKTGCRTY